MYTSANTMSARLSARKEMDALRAREFHLKRIIKATGAACAAGEVDASRAYRAAQKGLIDLERNA